MQSDKNFLSRPLKDFLSESEEAKCVKEGVTFNVKYVGSVEVYASMKVLDFQTRSAVARECIRRVCDAISTKTPQKRQVDKRVQQCISVNVCKEHAGSNVLLNISSRNLEIKSRETNEVIARHDMPRISFASGGDGETLDYVAYVAKDITEWRACYVIECGNEMAQSLISAMGHAFELRYKEYYGNEIDKKKNLTENLKRKEQIPPKKCDQEYYNDLPGKIPPDVITSTKSSKSPKMEKRRERISSNLIDLNTPIEKHHEYINEKAIEDDLFEEAAKNSPEAHLLSEIWYHGSISRALSESLLKNDGDFLVRESQNTRGQFVLTGMKSGNPKHLLLIDPEGNVRTKDRVFDNIPHLINFHWTKHLPIISAESALLLQTPVPRVSE